MTSQPELDRLLHAFFVEGTDEVADRVIDAALAQIDRTQQQRALRIPPRFQSMTAFARIAAAAVIGVIAIGGAFLIGSAPSSGPGASASLGPLASIPSQASTVTPTAVAVGPTGPPGPMGTGRQIHTATRLDDGRVLVVGGYALGDGPLASAVLYDPGTDTFSPTGSLAGARGYHTATLLSDGRVLIVGGGPASWPGSDTGITGPFLASAELYDSRTGTFSRSGSMATPREAHTATRLADGRVLIAGGADYQARAVASAELYDPKTGSFSPTGSMTTARAFQTATLLSDGRVLIAGGSPAAWGTTSKLASAEIYDPGTGAFTATGPMTQERDFHTATLLADGRVLLAGGSGISSEDLTSAEIFDPGTGAFTPTGPMTEGREYQSATPVSDGRVLLAGGGGDYTNRVFIASAELFDPLTGSFSATGSLADARTYHAATLLRDGRVLVTGGYGAVAPLASAEIYDPTTGAFSPAGSGG
jgi:hypothetical protein